MIENPSENGLGRDDDGGMQLFVVESDTFPPFEFRRYGSESERGGEGGSAIYSGRVSVGSDDASFDRDGVGNDDFDLPVSDLLSPVRFDIEVEDDAIPFCPRPNEAPGVEYDTETADVEVLADSPDEVMVGSRPTFSSVGCRTRIWGLGEGRGETDPEAEADVDDGETER